MNKKNLGQVFTPNYLVKLILDFGEYKYGNINKKHIIDNSCGNWAFLTEIVKRYCDDFFMRSRDINQLKNELETFIHWIEIDEDTYKDCIKNLSNIAYSYGLKNICWDIINWDALIESRYDWRMDFVVGNPPYVRIHNLKKEKNKKIFSCFKQGMTDLYIAFFEIGFRMLSPKWAMAVITPSSWLSSKAWSLLRKHLLEHKIWNGVIDLEHFQPFNAITYTVISRFLKNLKSDQIQYFTYDWTLTLKNSLALSDMYINDNFYLGSESDILSMKRIYKTSPSKTLFVKNGFATLADKVFIWDFDFSDLIIKVIKASTWETKKCIFPYNSKGELLEIKEIKQKFIQAYNYLKENKGRLLNRKFDKKWYGFWRSQAIWDVWKAKIVINTLIKDVSTIKLATSEPWSWVYGWLYILTDIPYEIIKKILISEEFIDYLRILKKYKSWGYYTFSSKDLKYFLDYKLTSY